MAIFSRVRRSPCLVGSDRAIEDKEFRRIVRKVRPPSSNSAPMMLRGCLAPRRLTTVGAADVGERRADFHVRPAAGRG